MISLLESAAELLREILAREITSPNDIVSMAVTGETFRRVAAHRDQIDPAIASLLERYDQTLRTHAAHVPDDLDRDLDDALATMRRAAGDETAADADDVLRAVDGVLMVAVAAHRVGKLPRSSLDLLASRALAASREIASGAHALWAEANDRAGRIGADPEFPALTDWLEPLASFSEARVAATVAARRGTDAERRDRAVRILLEKHAARKPSSATSNVRRLFIRGRDLGITRAAADDRPPEWDDGSGENVSGIAGLTIRVRPHDTPQGISIAIVIEAIEALGVDLAAPGTVDVVGAGLRRWRTEASRFHWLGLFDGTGDVEVRVGMHRVAFVIGRSEES